MNKLQLYYKSWEHIFIGTEIVLYLLYFIYFPISCPLKWVVNNYDDVDEGISNNKIQDNFSLEDAAAK